MPMGHLGLASDLFDSFRVHVTVHFLELGKFEIHSNALAWNCFLLPPFWPIDTDAICVITGIGRFDIFNDPTFAP